MTSKNRTPGGNSDKNNATRPTRDELADATGVLTDVLNVKDARTALVRDGYITQGEKMTTQRLAYVLLQAAGGIAKLPRPAVNILRASAFVLEEIGLDAMANEAVAKIDRKMDEIVHPKLTTAAETIAAATEASGKQEESLRGVTNQMTDTLNDLRANLDELTTRTKSTLETIEAATKMAEAATNQEQSDTDSTPTFASIVRTTTQIPSEHAAPIAKGNTLDKQIVVRRLPDTQDDPLVNLSEKELVEKATLALDLMGIQAADKPNGMAFVGARRTQSGTIIYTLNSTQAANYLKSKEVMRAFMAQFGGTSTGSSRTYQVVAEHVPTSFDPNEQTAIEKVEQASSLPRMAIYEARWIKPPHLRREGQRFAFLSVGFSTREAANHALEYGIFIEGKQCRTKKALMDPRRCMKCQKFGHIARDCKSIHDVCARCAGLHRTGDQLCGTGELRCANCQEGGHGAADRQCRVFKERLHQARDRDPDAKYRLFPTNNPSTWGRMDTDPMRNTFDTTWRRDAPTDNAPYPHPDDRREQNTGGRDNQRPHDRSHPGAEQRRTALAPATDRRSQRTGMQTAQQTLHTYWTDRPALPTSGGWWADEPLEGPTHIMTRTSDTTTATL
jgi:Zinc knuckle